MNLTEVRKHIQEDYGEYGQGIEGVIRTLSKLTAPNEWSDKYGSTFENDIFMIHPFCWCEQEDCPWCGEIGAMPQLLRDVTNAKYSDSSRAPNFWYKPTDVKVWWYKYIGRGMELNREVSEDEVETIYNECVKSL